MLKKLLNMDLESYTNAELAILSQQIISLQKHLSQELLQRLSNHIEQPKLSTLYSTVLQRKHVVVVDGFPSLYTEEQVEELCRKNNANMFLDLPQQKLTVHLSDFNGEFDFEKLSYPSQKILLFGITTPGTPLNQDNSWSHDTLKRYVFATRQLLKDNKVTHIIKTSKDKTLLAGSYYFNPRLKYIVIKNPKSTSNQPSINELNLE